MAHRVCPYILGYLLACPIRRLGHNPRAILSPLVKPGMAVLDIGCAMGFFTLPMAEMVGPSGKVLAVDVQDRMLRKLSRRAGKAGLGDRIVTALAGEGSLGLDERSGVDFALAFAVLHEVQQVASLLGDVYRVLKPGGRCLVAEPKGHVPDEEFAATIDAARSAGFAVEQGPAIWRSLTAMLVKQP